MDSQKLLLPYNFTPQDKKALYFVVHNFGKDKNTMVVLFHAYTALPEIQVSKSEVTSKLRENMSYLSQKISDRERALEEARKYLIDNGMAPENVRCVFKSRKKEVASEILDFSRKEKVDIVVLNPQSSGIKRFFTGNVFNKVVEGARNVTVSIVT
jgi:nucleotide-binding universal stress UspA family protein